MLARQCSALLHAPRGPAGLAETGPAPSGAAAPAGVSARGPRSAALLALSEHTGERRNVWWSVHVWPDLASGLGSSVSEDGLSWKDANRSEWMAHENSVRGWGTRGRGLRLNSGRQAGGARQGDPRRSSCGLGGGTWWVGVLPAEGGFGVRGVPAAHPRGGRTGDDPHVASHVAFPLNRQMCVLVGGG